MRISDWSSDVCSSDLQGLERLLRPGFGGRLVVEVAVDARRRPLGPQLGQPCVDAAADLAELRVGAIAEPQHREAQSVEPPRALGQLRLLASRDALSPLAPAPGYPHNLVLGTRAYVCVDPG